MDKDTNKMTESVRHISLDIIFLLIGEDYIVVKKTSGECVIPNSHPQGSTGWGRTQSSILEPVPHSLIYETSNEQKILKLSNKIIELMTGEVPIRCQDVTVYFSMEEWEYIEGHKDLYKDIMREKYQFITSPVSEYSEYLEYPYSLLHRRVILSLTDPPWINKEMTERILSITLKIIYLLSGEDYTIVKKTSGEYISLSNYPCVPGERCRAQRPILKPPSHSLIHERNNDEKILDLAYKIIELLTGEVPIRYQDVTVYFSMEEWEYLEGHKDLYKDIMKEDHQNLTSPGDSNSIYSAAGVHGPVFARTGNRVKRFKDGVSRSKKSKPVELTSCNMGNIKEPNTLNAHTPTEHVQQYPSPQVKKESVSSDVRNPKIFTPTDHAQQYSCLQFKEEPDSCDEENFTNLDVDYMKKNITAPHHNRCFVQTTKDGPTEVEVRSHHTVKDIVNNQQMARKMENTIPLERNPINDVSSENQDKKLKTFICSKCNKDFPDKQLLALHHNVHIREKLFLCSKCGKSFSNISHYIRHQSVHIGVKPYTCPECGKSFSDRSYLSKHQRMHADLISKPFKCPECEIRFMNQYELVAHCKIHTGKKPFECSECGKRFTRNYHLLKHEKVHTGDVPFLCSECGTCFRNNALLVKHQQYHSKEKQFSCSECGKSFSDRSHFVRHVRIHTGEKPFVCSECGRRFNDKSSLSRHRRLHTGEKPYACSQCGQSFRYSSSLFKHQEVHSISKPFKCTVCDTYFMSNSELLMHCSVHSAGK